MQLGLKWKSNNYNDCKEWQIIHKFMKYDKFDRKLTWNFGLYVTISSFSWLIWRKRLLIWYNALVIDCVWCLIKISPSNSRNRTTISLILFWIKLSLKLLSCLHIHYFRLVEDEKQRVRFAEDELKYSSPRTQ
jgi:hypothetical protein